MAPQEHDPNPDRGLDPEIVREIDGLMTGPVAARPTVIVVGDDAVLSFTPAPRTASESPRTPAQVGFGKPSSLHGRKPRSFARMMMHGHET
ncbi:hypothetical protein [Phenylobacterium sp.]|jgi:hypothetical protein|uniref:hypothetical protein n=1 Tax=Phenylobacterium sp. TaxID=1871053 RepID=UPI002E308275|nr:hypothetical protein [Phenylobacterium sp.]HEX3364732.1 hypothetical protein [Phenylobacterium sp.]